MSASYKGHIADIVGRRMFDGEITVDEGRIVSVMESNDVPSDAPYFLPGFIDSHVHIESSMMVPAEFARIEVDVTALGIGKKLAVGDLKFEGLTFMNPKDACVAQVKATRQSKNS